MRIIQEILGYFMFGAVGMAVLAIPCLPVCFLLRKKIPVIRQIVYFCFGVCIVIILGVTVLIGIRPAAAADRSLNLMPFRLFTEPWLMGEEKKAAQSLANILMFVPPGFLMPVAFRKVRSLWKTAVCMVFFSFFIEFIQYFTGRSADIDDLMLNTIGGILGYLVFALFSGLFGGKQFWKDCLAQPEHLYGQGEGHEEHKKKNY